MKIILVALCVTFFGVSFVDVSSLRANCDAEKYATETAAGVVAENYMKECKENHSFFIRRWICELGCPKVAAKAAKDASAAYEACLEKSKVDAMPETPPVTQENENSPRNG